MKRTDTDLGVVVHHIDEADDVDSKFDLIDRLLKQSEQLIADDKEKLDLPESL